jgi:serine/threonine protein kinase
MGIVLSLEQYQTLLVESGLLSRDEVRRFLSDLPNESTPTDAQGLAKALVKAEKLTKFQATAVYQGQIKELVLGEYEVLDKLGQGGMGIVLLARHRRMERLAAVKVLPKSTMKSPAVIDRFYREAKAAARLAHPNIVTAHDASEKNGTHYLVMEYVDGEDLAQVGKQRGPLPVEQAVEYMIQAARGLQYAHDQGVVHRDIKPANLLVDRNGTVKILDMGLARLHTLSEAEPTEQDRLTQSGQVMGTCDYMAPEQAEDTHNADHRADIYALGCSLYRLLTGEALYQGDALIKILMAHRDAAIPSLRDQRPDVSEELDSVFKKMVAKAPEDRYQSMSEVIAALEGCRVAAPVGAGPLDLEPGVSSEPSSDSKLTAFLQGLPEVGVAKSAPRPHGETIQGQAELETGEELDKPRAKKQPVWMLPALIGGGVFIVVLVVGLLVTQLGSEPAGKTEGDPVAQKVPQRGSVEAQDGSSLIPPPQPEPAETSRSEPKVPAELVERSTEEAATASPPKPSVQERLAEAQPATPSGMDREAEAARLAVIEAQRAAEAKYRQTIEAAETKVAAWDFLGAFQAIESIRFEEPALMTRLAARREEIRLMGALKQRIMAAINEADPPLEKSDLMIRGMGGQITSASEAGIAATLRNDKVETTAWTDAGDRATGKLLELAIDPTNGKMLLAGALLALAAGETGTAETYFDGAEAAGIDIAPYLVSVAAQSLSKAMELLDEQQYVDALERLEHIEAEYGSTDCFAANREALAAARVTAEKGILDAEAESLYAEAVKLREADQLFDLRDLVARLRSGYASSLVVGDATRSPTFVDLEESVADLGRKFTVRLDGEGDFTSIQAAIDAAPARSLIEIQDSGPYREKLVLPESKPKLTLRGAAGSWPVITSNGLGASLRTLVTVRSQHACLERLLLVHSEVPESGGGCLELNAEPSIVRSCILWKAVGHDHCLYSHSSDFRIENCVLLHSVGIQDADMKAKNCIWLRGDVGWVYKSASFENVVLSSLSPAKAVSVRNATIQGEVKLPKGSEMIDSIAASIECSHPDVRIEHCNFFSKTPFIDQAKPGKGCFVAPPMLANSKEFDFRLLPNSPCIGKASDGGDLGCRFTPEMLQMYQLAFELRARGIINF